MHEAIMLLFYGFLSGLVVMFTGLSVKKQISKHTAEAISVVGGTLAACCYVMILCCGYLTTVGV